MSIIKYKTPKIAEGFHFFTSTPTQQEMSLLCGGLDKVPSVTEEQFVEVFVETLKNITVWHGYDSPYNFGNKLRRMVDDELAEIFQINGCYICIADSGKTSIYNPNTLLRK